ncbi:MAG: VanZ family protein [Bacteroidota bacterium]|uniref:VanZ family protein n=1 Tax=Christiangramia sp. TaxID=1931228 RepID=UPI002E8C5176|nr:VanZ family protein [Bacteroidota bacterium]
MVARILFILAAAYTGLITWLSLTHLGKISIGGFNPTDKMLHAGAYLFLMLLWKFYFIFRNEKNEAYRSNLLWVGLGCVLFGMLIEVLQGTMTSYRTPDWWDVLANSTGIAIAALFLIVLAPKIINWKQKIV